MPTERFRSKEAYRKNLAYRHIHGIPMTATRVTIGGRTHKVDHSRDTPQRKKINDRQRRKVRREATRVRTPGSRHHRSYRVTSYRRKTRG